MIIEQGEERVAVQPRVRFPVAVGISVVALAILAAVLWARHAPPAAAPSVHPAIATATARLGVIEETLEEYGRVGPPAGAQSNVAFAVPGIIHSIDVRVGQQVSAGQVLATLDAAPYEYAARDAQAQAAAAQAAYAAGTVPAAQVQGARARVAAAQQRIVVDRAALRREQTLEAAGIAAAKDVEAAQAQLASDQAALTSAEADLRAAQTQPVVLAADAASAQAKAAAAAAVLRRTSLTAPVSGVVEAIFKHVGESADTTTPVLAIGPVGQNEATLDVPGSDARRIAPGDAAIVTVDAGGASASGRVVGVVPSVDPATQNSTVVVSGVPPGSVAGSAVHAVIEIGMARGIVIPSTAIVQDPQSGDSLVFVREDNPNGSSRYEQRVVQVAYDNGKQALIARGLRAGETVAAQGGFALLAPSSD